MIDRRDCSILSNSIWSTLQCVIGSTGPVLAFTKAVVRIADNIGVPFLTFSAWCPFLDFQRMDFLLVVVLLCHCRLLRLDSRRSSRHWFHG